MSFDLLTNPTETTRLVYRGPEGSPNGSLVSDPGCLVVAADGDIYVKAVGSDEYGWVVVTRTGSN